MQRNQSLVPASTWKPGARACACNTRAVMRLRQAESGSCWPASLAESVMFGFTEWPCLRSQQQTSKQQNVEKREKHIERISSFHLCMRSLHTQQKLKGRKIQNFWRSIVIYTFKRKRKKIGKYEVQCICKTLKIQQCTQLNIVQAETGPLGLSRGCYTVPLQTALLRPPQAHPYPRSGHTDATCHKAQYERICSHSLKLPQAVNIAPSNPLARKSSWWASKFEHKCHKRHF